MRLFLAINLAAAVRDEIVEAAAPLRSAAPDLRWLDSARIHLTLKFLDEQPESSVPAIVKAMDAVAPKHFTFDMGVGDGEHTVGAFPNFRRPRVVWMGVANDPRLELLHHDVELACDAIGFAVEGRPFRPHLTLARVKDRVDATILRRLERAANGVVLAAESEVTSIDLMQSITGAEPRYERLHSSPLKAR
ncbi:MAG TPA: RNA 2',3'-cyclic phosphodiesterase [Gemmatimonadaceae bacterium]